MSLRESLRRMPSSRSSGRPACARTPSAISVGDYRYDDRLDDYTAAHRTAVNTENQAYLVRLTAISTAGFPDQDLLSHQLMERGLRQRIEDYNLKTWEMSISQQNGVHTSLSDLPNAVPLDSVKHYDDYIARLHQIPRALAESIDVLRLGVKDGLMQPRFILEKVAAQAADVAKSKPFLLPIQKIPASFSDADRQRITSEIQKAVDTEVVPAYLRFAAFIANEYAPHGRAEISLASLPDGKHRYEVAVREMTTTNMTPGEIHQLGLDEIKRITAQMTDLAHMAGYQDLASFRGAVKTNPKYIPTLVSTRSLDDFTAITSTRCGRSCLNYLLGPSRPGHCGVDSVIVQTGACHSLPDRHAGL